MIKLNQSGQILIFVFAALGVMLFIVLFVVTGSSVYYQSSQYSFNAESATNIAEAGVDKALASLNKTGGSYNGESETFLGEGSYSVIVTNKDASTKIIQSTGYIPNKSTPKVKRTISIQVSTGTGISFVYGMLIGDGGITMGNGSIINGSVYSNGNISGGNNEKITGDAYVAGGTQALADQQNDCSSNCDYIFGKSVSGESRLDVAQSFKPGSTAVINKVSVKLKKVGSPANLSVRIMTDSSGSPNKNNVLTSGTLPANLVSGQYGFADVTFNSSPTLTANTSYWIMIAAQVADNSNYWYWANDLSTGYNRGSPKWSPDWQAKNPSWNAVSGDFSFKTWMGGVSTSISMGNGSVVQGSVHANTIDGFTINKDAYYQTIDDTTVNGVSYPNSSDPPPIAMPISDANIADWENLAAGYGITSGDINGCPSTIGPGKFTGNFITGNNCTILVKTPFYLTGPGNLTVGNSVIFQMDPSLGAASGVMIVDGLTVFGNGDDLKGTGQTGSYLTLLSTYNSTSTTAIDTGNSSITGILYAPYGTISLANTANFKEAVARKINMGTGTILTYDSGLINTFFSAGPGGSFSLVKGTYQVK